MAHVDPADRKALQVEGADLDRRTNGRWLMEYLIEHIELRGGAVVDSLRTVRQTEPILKGVPGSILVYLDAHEETRRSRYLEAARRDPLKRAVSFDQAMQHETERDVVRLRQLAHVIIETDRLTPEDTVAEILA